MKLKKENIETSPGKSFHHTSSVISRTTRQIVSLKGQHAFISENGDLKITRWKHALTGMHLLIGYVRV